MARSSGTVVALRPETVTVEAAERRFLSERDLAPSTRRVYGATLDALAAEVGPDSPLADVTASAVEAHLRSRYSKATPATYNRQIATLRSFFGWALRRRGQALESRRSGR